LIDFAELHCSKLSGAQLISTWMNLGPPARIVAARGLGVGAALFDAQSPVGPEPMRSSARFSAVAVDPEEVWTWRVGMPGDPFAILAAAGESVRSQQPDDGWPRPLVACALGYDLGRVIEDVPSIARREGHLPDLWCARYSAVYVWDRAAEAGRIFARDAAASARLLGWLTASTPAPVAPHIGPASAEMDRATYNAAIAEIQARIKAGDVYQVNFALRFSAPISAGDPAPVFERLHARSPVPFACALRLDASTSILSISPERFLTWDAEGTVETRPIKGTRPRSADASVDAGLIADLKASPKDAAEHVMIVDLQRNDLGRVCAPGTVEVTSLAAVESYATVHHLVSVVEGVRRDANDLNGLLRATFPGGSITGAPKISAMGIIDALEPVRRGMYCGSVGYLDARGGGDLNIAIRTAILTSDRLYYSAGGGIVADSDADAEWAEAWDKARAFIEACGDSAPE
jgi:para-aminobenzoate synthetase component 1